MNLRIAHGTRNRYQRGCRCVMCRAGNAAHRRQMYAEHPDTYQSIRERYYAAHREEIIKRNSEYTKNHSEQHNEWNRKCDAAHRVERREMRRQYRISHPEVVRACCRRHKARKLNASGDHSADDVMAQYERQQGKCFWCKEKLDRYHVDHVVPLAKGGSNGPENLVISCPLCNQTKNARHPMDFAGVML